MSKAHVRLPRFALAVFASAAALQWAATPSSSDSGEMADSSDVRISISVEERRLWLVTLTGDTLLSASVAVGSGKELRIDGKRWVFRTPTGETVVRSKEEKPVWIPPDWHYHEIARKSGFQVEKLLPAQPVRLKNGGVLMVRGNEAGVLDPDSSFSLLPRDEEIVFGNTLYIPPFGTANRMVEGALGEYRLNLANGVGIHGTPFKESIGRAVTHGCVRMHDRDLEQLYLRAPVGTRVLIY